MRKAETKVLSVSEIAAIVDLIERGPATLGLNSIESRAALEERKRKITLERPRREQARDAAKRNRAAAEQRVLMNPRAFGEDALRAVRNHELDAIENCEAMDRYAAELDELLRDVSADPRRRSAAAGVAIKADLSPVVSQLTSEITKRCEELLPLLQLVGRLTMLGAGHELLRDAGIGELGAIFHHLPKTNEALTLMKGRASAVCDGLARPVTLL